MRRRPRPRGSARAVASGWIRGSRGCDFDVVAHSVVAAVVQPHGFAGPAARTVTRKIATLRRGSLVVIVERGVRWIADMPTWRTWPALFSIALAVFACASSGPPIGSPGGSEVGGETPPGQPPRGVGAAPSGDSPGSSGAAPAANEPTGIVVIDVQNKFVTTASRRNAGSDIAGRVVNDKAVLDLAKARQVPVFITYEAEKTGDSALPPSLAGDVPAGAQEFIKTTFDATGQPQFAAAIKASGLRRLLVVGSETDVCVMQTILGLRRQGIEVIALVDALFSEEVNVVPALRRLRQAGVAQIAVADADAILAGRTPVTFPPSSGVPPIVRPFEIGIVLHGLDKLGADPNASAKQVRLKELLTISEWFRIPVFASDPTTASNALPAALRSILTHGILPLASRPSATTQLAFAGAHDGVLEAASTLRQSGADVFLVEDVLIGGSSKDLEPAYAAGAIPTTYKSLYYELTHSVSDAEWPSQQWVTDGTARYYDQTLAPEELPPIGESP